MIKMGERNKYNTPQKSGKETRLAVNRRIFALWSTASLRRPRQRSTRHPSCSLYKDFVAFKMISCVNELRFKQHLSSIGPQRKESGENFDNFKSVSNKSVIGKQPSRADHRKFSPVDIDKPNFHSVSEPARSPRDTGEEVMTIPASKYSQLINKVEASRKITEGLCGTVDLRKEKC